METIGRLWRKIRVALGSSWFDRELEEEVRQHLEWRTRDAIDGGMDEVEARRAAARRLGGTLQIRETSREAWGLTWPRDLAQDLRYGLRLLRRDPGFSVVAILSLALGIGANTAIFSLLDAVVYRPLPVRAPQELVLFGESASLGVWFGVERGERTLFSHDEYRALRDGQRSLAGVLAVSEAPGESIIRLGDESNQEERAVGVLVSGNYFEVLGVIPRVGRTLTSADDVTPGGHPVTVISDAYWSRRFSRDPAVLGQTIRLGRAALAIVGVAASGFTGDHVGSRTDFWIPLSMQAEIMPHRAWRADPKALWLRLLGRLRPHQETAQSAAGLNVTLQQILAAGAGASLTGDERRKLLDQRITLTSAATGVSRLRERFSGSLRIIMAMVVLVLLVACTNLATLMLARATAREKELGMRLALGAGRARVLRQWLTESLLLSAIGALVGLAVARVCGQLLLQMASSGQDPIPLALPMDGRLLGFTAGTALLATLIVGVGPALRLSRLDPNVSLRPDAAGGTRARFRLPVRKALVVAQVAITLVLLVAAGLFVATLRNLSQADLGFNRRVLQVGVDGIAAGYEGQRLLDLGRRLVERLRSVPGVAAVSLSDNGLLTGSDSMTEITVLGDRARSDDDRSTRFDRVSPGHFHTLGIPVIVGREFAERDGQNVRDVALISQAMAHYYFGDGEALGRQFVMDADDGPPRPITIVGVVADARELGLRSSVVRRFYLPYFQATAEALSLRLQLRLSAPEAGVKPVVRAAIREVDPSLEVFSMLTADERLGRLIVRDRLTARLATIFGLLAAFLAATGLYGILAYTVARRTKEIGIRMALGARREEIAGLVIRDGALMVLAGVALGLPVALLAGRAVSSQLFGLAPFDPVVIATALAALAVAAGLAAYWPARHAARVDPLVALRRE